MFNNDACSAVLRTLATAPSAQPLQDEYARVMARALGTGDRLTTSLTGGPTLATPFPAAGSNWPIAQCPLARPGARRPALFQIKNTTANDVVWTPNFYATSNGAWGENASISANGVNVWSSSANTNGAQAYSAPITLKANQVNNVVFTSTAGALASGSVRSNQLGFIGDSLALSPGLEVVDQLPSNVFRTATFNT